MFFEKEKEHTLTCCAFTLLSLYVFFCFIFILFSVRKADVIQTPWQIVTLNELTTRSHAQTNAHSDKRVLCQHVALYTHTARVSGKVPGFPPCLLRHPEVVEHPWPQSHASQFQYYCEASSVHQAYAEIGKIDLSHTHTHIHALTHTRVHVTNTFNSVETRMSEMGGTLRRETHNKFQHLTTENLHFLFFFK